MYFVARNMVGGFFLEVLPGSGVIFGFSTVCQSYLFPTAASASSTQLLLNVC